MQDLREIVIVVIELYLALGLIVVGFGYLFSGKAGGARAAQFYFARSLAWTLRHVRALVATVLITLWGAFVLWIGRPLLHALLRGFRWFATRERGWLRQR